MRRPLPRQLFDAVAGRSEDRSRVEITSRITIWASKGVKARKNGGIGALPAGGANASESVLTRAAPSLRSEDVEEVKQDNDRNGNPDQPGKNTAHVDLRWLGTGSTARNGPGSFRTACRSGRKRSCGRDWCCRYWHSTCGRRSATRSCPLPPCDRPRSS